MVFYMMKLMLLYLIEIGMRLRRFVRYWANRICKLFQKEKPLDVVGEPVLLDAENDSKYFDKLYHEMEAKCTFLAEERKHVDEAIDSYRKLMRGWKELLAGMDNSVRYAKGEKKTIESAIRYLLKAKGATMASEREFNRTREAVESYEQTMGLVTELLTESGTIKPFQTEDLPRLTKANVALYHIHLLREEVLFMQKFLTTASTPGYGPPQTWEEELAKHKEALST